MKPRPALVLVAALLIVPTLLATLTARPAHGAAMTGRLRVQARVLTGDLVGGVTSAAGSIWAVGIYPREELLQIDASTNSVLARIPLGGTPSPGEVAWITFGDGALWISRSLAGEVDRVDPATRQITARVVMDSPFDVAVAGNTVFVPQFDPYQWSTIDGSSAAITGSHASVGPSSAVFDNNAIWILQHRAKSLIRIDPATDSVTEQVPVKTGGGVPERITAGFGSIWATDPRSSSIARIDESTGRQVKEIRLPVEPLWGPYPITTGGGSVWVSTDHGVARINPSTNRVTAALKLAYDNKTCGPATQFPCTDGIAYASGSVWVADWNKRQLLRISP